MARGDPGLERPVPAGGPDLWARRPRGADEAAHHAACLGLDVRLPGLSDFELRARLAAEGVRAPVVFMTAHNEQIGRDAARQAGATAYLLKPFAGKELLDAVARAFAGHTEME